MKRTITDGTKLWLDDYREPPNGNWTWAATKDEAIAFMNYNTVTVASLDFDLGGKIFDDSGIYGGAESGMGFVEWMIARDIWPTDRLTIHTSNAEAAGRMIERIRSANPSLKVEYVPARD